MKVSKDQMVQHREQILDKASSMFREKGFEGVTVNELMKEAGFTHGGFYNHFESKEQLASLAVQHAFNQLIDRWNVLCETAGAEPLPAIVQSYLSETHYKAPKNGCVVAALGTETARQSKPVKTAMAVGVGDLLKLLEANSSSRTQRQRRKKAVITLSQMVGAMVLARSNNDQSLAKEILATVTESLTHNTHAH